MRCYCMLILIATFIQNKCTLFIIISISNHLTTDKLPKLKKKKFRVICETKLRRATRNARPAKRCSTYVSTESRAIAFFPLKFRAREAFVNRAQSRDISRAQWEDKLSTIEV